MSNFLKKGKREIIKQQKKINKHTIANFTKTMEAMNYVYISLMNDNTVTIENLESKIKALSDFKFSDKQLHMLARDVLTNKGLIENTENTNEKQQQNNA